MSAQPPPPPRDRPALAHRGSKSKLSKQQAEVESEEPPRKPIPETRVESFEAVDAPAVGASYGEMSPQTRAKTLVRSHALCGDDDTKLNTQLVKKQCSSKSASAGSSLSRDSSSEYYTDSTGINLEEFIVNTLHKNAKDRQMLLQLEEQLRAFVGDATKQVHRFPSMSSYNRMLVHRVSAFFGLDHNVDQSGCAVVVNKTDSTRLYDCHCRHPRYGRRAVCSPDVGFRAYIRNDVFADDCKRSLRHDAHSYEEPRMIYLKVRSDSGGVEYRKARSFDERDDHYERSRRSMFAQGSSSSAEVVESPASGYSSDSVQALLRRDVAGRAQWISSSDSHSSSLDVPPIPARASLAMQKAGSFGGVPSIYRQTSTVDPSVARQPRRSNTDTSRAPAELSPSQSCRQPSIPEGSVMAVAPQQVIFAVAGLDQVPPGAVIINPQTGQPYLTATGAPYRSPPTSYGGGQATAAAFVQPRPPGQFVSMEGRQVLTAQMQGLTMQPASSPDAAVSRPPAFGSPHAAPLYGAYVMPTQSESSLLAGQQPLLVAMPYMQSSPYSSSIQYFVPPAQTVYTEASLGPTTDVRARATAGRGSGVGVQVTYAQAPTSVSATRSDVPPSLATADPAEYPPLTSESAWRLPPTD